MEIPDREILFEYSSFWSSIFRFIGILSNVSVQIYSNIHETFLFTKFIREVSF